MTDKQLSLILDKLSSLGADGMALATRQAIIDGWIGIAIAALLVPITVALVIFLVRKSKSESDDFIIGACFAALAGTAMTVALLSISLGRILNPQWAAVNSIVGLFIK